MIHDILIVGGGPSGLAAALALGRARKRVLLCDAGPRRNAAAVHLHNFVTRDGTPPDAFRQAARDQLAAYPDVAVRDALVESIAGERGAFRIRLDTGPVEARRILLATGMIDEMLPIPGFRELWGTSIFQCPYCHGWEVQDQPWGYLATPSTASHVLPFGLQMRGWSRDVTVFANGIDLPAETRAAFETARVRLETAPVARLVAPGGALEAVELAGGRRAACAALFVHPPQRQTGLVAALGVALDERGFVAVDPMKRETTVPGIYAAGDLTSPGQSAIFGAAAGTQAAAAINVELTMELALAGAL